VRKNRVIARLISWWFAHRSIVTSSDNQSILQRHLSFFSNSYGAPKFDH
jgi:hypothetical protein